MGLDGRVSGVPVAQVVDQELTGVLDEVPGGVGDLLWVLQGNPPPRDGRLEQLVRGGLVQAGEFCHRPEGLGQDGSVGRDLHPGPGLDVVLHDMSSQPARWPLPGLALQSADGSLRFGDRYLRQHREIPAGTRISSRGSVFSYGGMWVFPPVRFIHSSQGVPPGRSSPVAAAPSSHARLRALVVLMVPSRVLSKGYRRRSLLRLQS